MIYDRDAHVAAEAKDLVNVSVRADDIEAVIVVKKNGLYTRELCGKGNIADC